MKEWTLEERYRVLQSPEDIRDLYGRIRESKYRQLYHVQPVTGLSSDPNGFVCHEGTWHLYYQWCPWGAVHGLKYWYHVSSPDLVHWTNEGVGLRPDTVYDNKGTHSGSAISKDGKMYLFYTGNHRDENWIRTPYTCAAVTEDGKDPRKLPEPLFGPRAGYSEHQRDPKILWNAEREKYYIFIGAQTEDGKGTALVYESDELLGGWSFAGELRIRGIESLGGMWECPYIVRIGGKDLLLFSPQYTKLPGRGESTNHNVYFTGRMDYDSMTFEADGPFRFLDYGFDFYAAQGAQREGRADEAVLIAWIGLPDNHYPTAEEEWEGSMTLPRILTIKDGRLYQNPVQEMASLRGEEAQADDLPAACEILADFDGKDASIALFAKKDGTGGLTFRYDAEKQELTADRSGMDIRFNEKIFENVQIPLDTPLRSMRIFADRSSVEVFINDGEETFTTHLYPTEEERRLVCSEGTACRIFHVCPSVKDDFVI